MGDRKALFDFGIADVGRVIRLHPITLDWPVGIRFRCGCFCVIRLHRRGRVRVARRRWWYPRCRPEFDQRFVAHESIAHDSGMHPCGPTALAASTEPA